MTRRLLLLPATLLLSLGFAAQPAGAPTEAQVKQRINAMAPKPTDQHKVLEALVGKWDERTEVHAGPVNLHAHSLAESKWILDGRFVQLESASAPDEDLKGQRMVVFGYDPATSKYTWANYETGSFIATTATGDYDAATKTFTFTGTRAIQGGATAPFKLTLAVTDDGTLTQSLSLQLPSQADFTEIAKTTRTKQK